MNKLTCCFDKVIFMCVKVKNVLVNIMEFFVHRNLFCEGKMFARIHI